jgi:hypothetical protein
MRKLRVMIMHKSSGKNFGVITEEALHSDELHNKIPEKRKILLL